MKQLSPKALVRSLNSANFAIQHVHQKNKVRNPTSLKKQLHVVERPYMIGHITIWHILRKSKKYYERTTRYGPSIEWFTRKPVRILQFRGKPSHARTVSCGSLLILLLFLKICQMVICPVRATYNHVSIFLCSRTRKGFKIPSRATFAIAKFPYLFGISQLTRKF